MKQKKKIDDIYREGLRNAETPPPADSWEFISSRLPEKKKEKVLPLWIKWGGVAALLALLLTVFNFAFFETPLPTPVVDREENVDPVPSPASEVTPEADTRITDTDHQDQNEVSGGSSSEKASGITSSEKISTEVASSDAKAEAGNLNRDALGSKTSRSEVVAVTETEGSTTEEEHNSAVRKAEKVPSASEALAEATEASETTLEKDVLKPAIKTGEEILKEDAAFATAEPEEVNTKSENFLKRFRISTTAGAVYFDAGNGSTVDEQFAQNAGGSEVSMSYGVNVAYKLSEKVKIRSGVSKVNMNYSTRQVDYSAATASSAVRFDPAMNTLLSAQGSLDQEFGFIEVPLEVEFTLIDKKIGLNLIGGASTLFLDENRLSMTTSNFTTDLGEAQNLNNLSFSANFGLGVHYKFAPQFRLNLEPIFKYQLNTFNNSSGLNPYYFGIYSGVSYQF